MNITFSPAASVKPNSKDEYELVALGIAADISLKTGLTHHVESMVTKARYNRWHRNRIMAAVKRYIASGAVDHGFAVKIDQYISPSEG